MKEMLKKLARAVLGEYSVYHVLCQDRAVDGAVLADQSAAYRVVLVDHATILACGDPLMQEQAGFAGEEALAYAFLQGDQIVGL